MTLQYVPDSDHPHQIVADLMGATAPGSYLVVSDTARDFDQRTETANARLNQRMGPVRQTRRSREEIGAYFDGLDLVDPGLVLMPEWRALAHPKHVINCYAGVARKSRLPGSGRGLGTRLQERAAAIGGVELEPPARDEQPRAADLDW
jgi:hypothetical protein